jgi:hypothetical protein
LFPLGLEPGATVVVRPHAGAEMLRFDSGAFGAGLVIVVDGFDARFHADVLTMANARLA